MNYIIGAFKPPCDISITFSDARTRKQVSVKKDNGKTTMVPVFQSLETLSGEVSIAPVPGKRIEHMGVKIELLGQIELYFDRGNFYDFTSLATGQPTPEARGSIPNHNFQLKRHRETLPTTSNISAPDSSTRATIVSVRKRNTHIDSASRGCVTMVAASPSRTHVGRDHRSRRIRSRLRARTVARQASAAGESSPSARGCDISTQPYPLPSS
ncbi:unnamed protein product [Urochloa humidicola]